MNSSSTYDVCSGLDQFTVIGLNHHKTDTATRSAFAINAETYALAAGLAGEMGLKDLIILSTCNRTEVYGLASSDVLAGILCSVTKNATSLLTEHGYARHGMEAVEHLFRVAAGLDSRIIGDYEILMQLKQATRLAREHQMLGSLLDRLVNFALQSSKRIKTETRLSTGTVSVGFAAIEVIREKVADVSGKKFLLIGAGKFGQNVVRNINEYFPEAQLCIVNRSPEKAQSLAEIHQNEWISYESIQTAANEANVIVVSTSAEEYTLVPEFFSSIKPRLILDLSVPRNVDPAVKDIAGAELMDVDEISGRLDHTLLMRQNEVPRALEILHETIGEFVEWHKIFLQRHFLMEVKSKLYELSREQKPGCPIHQHSNEESTEVRIQKAVKNLAVELKSKSARGCQYITTLNHYLQIP